MQRSVKLFLKCVSLNMLGMLGISFYILADTFFIAQALGPNGIASLNLSIPIFGIMHGFGLMLGLGGATRYKILLSQNKQKQAIKVYSQTLLFALAFGVMFFIVGQFGSGAIANISGANPETFEPTSIYLRTVLTLAPFFILNNTLLSFVRNDGDPTLAMFGMITGSLLNVLLDYIFIFPLEMGMFGAALATSLSPVISLGVLMIHYFKPLNNLSFVFQKIEKRLVRDIMFLGSSAFVNEISGSVVMFTFNTIIFSLEGNDGLAAYGIIANVSFVVLSLFAGIAQGTQPLFSESYGLKNLSQIKQVLVLSLGTSLILSTVIYLSTYLYSDQLIAIFNSEQNPHIAEMATTGLLVYFAGFFFAGINIVSTSYFGATNQPKRSLLFSMLRGGIIIVPLVIVLSHFYEMKGVWLSFVFAEMSVMLLIAWKMNPEKRIRKRKRLG
ncbi:MAG: MATE family efflux transporter [Alkalibacterium sp.]|uniref:MATE family efflux transporter n=1 Tax=Alkalibacterium TaxID=99906 RepID=UPI002647F362|nr:MATE family efflux transporter [Alkalibacterium sp.]MDN6293865.1 MATE family efflux transporter [Alkalibacterium sp.]MDN6295195.1 MATE family efflux transporter [Alkalibacterium sp.]MDN6729834.1 MATE family efflux transporter [Alkalibacterium sp.]